MPIWVLLLLVILLGWLPFPIWSPQLKTETVTATNIWNIKKSHSDYILAWSASQGDNMVEIPNDAPAQMGQMHCVSGSIYAIYRNFAKFDTTFLEGYSIIESATLSIRSHEFVRSSWRLNIQYWVNEDEQATLDDFDDWINHNYDYGDKPSTWSMESESTLQLDLRDTSIIRKEEMTYICLRIDSDVNAQPPPTDSFPEYQFYSDISLTINYYEGGSAGGNGNGNPDSLRPIEYFLMGGISFLLCSSCSQGKGGNLQ